MLHLLSKIVAGGLSAGVILLWWPLVFPSDTVESWLVRGVLWTLCFELMLHAFAPVEESLWRTRTARRVARQAQAAGARLGTASPRKRLHGRWILAGAALLVPVMLLATAPSHRLGPQAARAEVRQITKVKRIVRVEHRALTVPRSPVAPARPSASDAPAARPARAQSPGPSRAASRDVSPRRVAETGEIREPAGRSPSKTDPPATPQEPAAAAPAPPPSS